MNAAARAVAVERLTLSRAPAAELAAAALDAQADADLDRADLIVVAVPPGTVGHVIEVIRDELEDAVRNALEALLAE